MKKNATVTVCHTRTVDMAGTCRNAEVVVAAAGVAKMIDKSFISEDAVVIDVGINVDEDGNLCGDVNFDEVAPLCEAITPVPGGVGQLTVACVIRNLVQIYQNFLSLSFMY